MSLESKPVGCISLKSCTTTLREMQANDLRPPLAIRLYTAHGILYATKQAKPDKHAQRQGIALAGCRFVRFERRSYNG